ncbi:MAG: hypothetical protein ABW252_06235 [Polyangiales bacterium]
MLKASIRDLRVLSARSSLLNATLTPRGAQRALEHRAALRSLRLSLVRLALAELRPAAGARALHGRRVLIERRNVPLISGT